jgi:hypothetical protein
MSGKASGEPDAAAGRDVVPLALLAGYKVRWSRQTVARDIVQYFFDAAEDFGEVTIDTATPGRVRVEGPATFDLDYLRYLGATSKRDKRAAGGFGEGFKICALVLLRDYHVRLSAGSGPWEVRPFFRRVKLGRELCYEIVRHPPEGAPSGSWVEIGDADPDLVAAFTASRDCFRHPENPRLSKPIHEDEESGSGVYASLDPLAGDVFYRRQLRGSLPFSSGSALTFAFDDRILDVEADRDRRGLRAPQRVMRAVVAKLPSEVLEEIAMRLRPYWRAGNQVLSAVVGEAARRGATFTFPSRWLASVRGEDRLEEQAERRGHLLAMPSMARVGMPTAVARFGSMDTPRPPTLREEARLAVAASLYEELLQEAPPKRRTYVREIPKGHAFFGRVGEVVDLQATTLAGSFDEGVGDVLGALSRHPGKAGVDDGKRLTKLLAAVLDRAGDDGRFDDFRARWDAAAELPDTPTEDDGTSYRTYGWEVPRVEVEILAPPGFPPAEEIERRLLRVTRQVRVQLEVRHVAVTSLESAVRERARGVPSIWIAGVEIASPGGPARYELRTYAGEGGAASLTGPSDAELLAPIEAALRKKRRLTQPNAPTKRALSGQEAHERWLASNRRGEADALSDRRKIAAVVERAIADYPPAEEATYETGPRGFAIAALERAAAADPGTAGEEAAAPLREVATQAVLAYDRMMRAVQHELAKLAHVHDRIWVLFTLDDYAANLAREAPPDDVARVVVPLAVPFATLMGQLAATAALDEGCLSYGRAFVRRGFLDHAHNGPEAALKAGRAQIAVVVRASRALHRGADPESAVSLCAGMQAILDATAEKRKAMSALQVQTRVKAAWKAAISAGKPEIEAALACLDAAEAAQAEVLAGQEAERKEIAEAARRRSRAALARAQRL